jgi:YfiH family protein
MTLPSPSDGFEWVETAGGPALVCRPLAAIAPHLFTARSWRLGSADSRNDPSAWREVARGMTVGLEALLHAHQVHGADVIVHRAGGPAVRGIRADIMISDDAETALTIQTADCVPLLVADSRRGVVAAAHAGWRGTALHVASRTVQALIDEFGSRPSDLVAAVGPSIGPCCYVVGSDVHDRFRAAGFSEAQAATWFRSVALQSDANPPMAGVATTAARGRWFFDIWSATVSQLEEAGVPRHQIALAELCTASHQETFCSYRRDGARAGRLAAAIRAHHSVKGAVR